MCVCFGLSAEAGLKGLRNSHVVPCSLLEFLKYATFWKKKDGGRKRGKREKIVPTDEQHMDKFPH